MRPNQIWIVFALILALMIIVTTWASLEEGVGAGFFHVTQYRWGWATLADTYCGFLTFFVFVYFNERALAKRLLWFVLIMTLGNIAMAAYALLYIRGLNRGEISS